VLESFHDLYRDLTLPSLKHRCQKRALFLMVYVWISIDKFLM